MSIAEEVYNIRRRDHERLAELDLALRHADRFEDVRDDLLVDLGFVPDRRNWWSRLERYIEKYALRFSVVPFVIPSAVLLIGCYYFDLLSKGGTAIPAFAVGSLGVVAAYQTWRRTRLNTTVDDALKRKDAANALILEHSKLLKPYVQSAFSGALTGLAPERDGGSEIVVDMYLYTEIDNLEFVFDKSNHNLIDEQFVMRAIKIFVVRNESTLFRERARELLKKGQYNKAFRLAAEKLILVAEWRQNNPSDELLST
ncbi:hypothetical protein SAMN02990966_01186 [Rhodospirillales bacterium URHD0017]|nr:hypothetical protein SAMN02990966_01186 [Rhodospirillales bacterium URHD0017]